MQRALKYILVSCIVLAINTDGHAANAESKFDLYIRLVEQYLETGEIKQAKEYFNKAKTKYTESHKHKDSLRLMELNADILFRSYDIQEAYDQYSLVLSGYKSYGNSREAILRTKFKLGLVASLYLYRHIEGLNHFYEALSYVNSMEAVKWGVKVYRGIAAIHAMQENNQSAHLYLNKALKLSLANHYHQLSAQIIFDLGVLKEYEGQFNIAEDFFKKAYYNLEMHQIKDEGLKYIIAAKYHWYDSNHKKGLENFDRAIAAYKKAHKYKELVLAIYSNGEAFIKLNKLDEAKKFLKEGYGLSEKYHFKFEQEKLAEQLYKLYKKTNNEHLAFLMLEKYTMIKDSVLDNQIKKEIAGMQAMIEVERKEKELKEAQQNAEILAIKTQEATDEIKRNRIYIVLYGVAALILFVFVILMYRAVRKNIYANKRLERQAGQLTILNKELTKLSLVASKTDNGVVFLDSSGTIEWVNKGLEAAFAMNQRKLTGTKINKLLKEELGCEDKLFGEDTISNNQIQIKTPYKTSWFIASSTLLENNSTIIILSDITEIKEAQEKLLHSLNEKNLLLKEVHHRVKNNLQIITSLLTLQSKSVTDEKSLAVFKDSQNRVKSMALVHEKLYHVDNLETIEFGGYIRSLFEYLKSTYNIQSAPISFIYEIKDFEVKIDMAIPLGLLINEFASQIIRRSVILEKPHTVKITITDSSESKRQLVFIHEFKESVQTDEDDKFTGQLVQALSRQIRAKCDIELNDNSAKYTLGLNLGD